MEQQAQKSRYTNYSFKGFTFAVLSLIRGGELIALSIFALYHAEMYYLLSEKGEYHHPNTTCCSMIGS